MLADRAVDGALPDELPRPSSSARRLAARARPAVRRRAQRASSRRSPLAVLAHMRPAATRSSPRRSPGRGACRCCSGSRTGSRAATLVLAERLSTAVLTVDRRSFPLALARRSCAIGHGIDTRALPLRRARARPSGCACVALGRTSPAKGLETIARAAALAGVELELRGPSLDRRGARRARAARGARRRASSEPVRTPRSRSCSPRKDVLVNNMREGALDKVVYEAAATCMPVLASNTRLRRRAAARAALRARRRRRPRREAACASRTSTATRSAASCARGSRRATRSSTGPTRVLEVARAMIVLHVQKVAGISGSEAHLLQLLPDLQAARLGHPLPDAARARAGRVGVRARARGGRRAGRRDPDARRRRPGTFVRVLAYLVDAPADDPAHAPRARRRLRADGRHARGRAGAALDQARLQRVPRGAHLRARRPDDRRARAPADRDLARPRPLPRRDRGLPGARLRDRPLRHRRRPGAASRTPATRRASSASAA